MAAVKLTVMGGKPAAPTVAKPSVFQDDVEDNGSKSAVNRMIRREAAALAGSTKVYLPAHSSQYIDAQCDEDRHGRRPDRLCV